MKHVILGSGSPRRRELLAGLDIDFKVDTLNNFEEYFNNDIQPHEIPILMSEGKSHGFHRDLSEDEILITADTVVIVNDSLDGSRPAVLGKPHSREDAVRMLNTLSGRTHEVVTAVTIRTDEYEETLTDSTLVTFSPLSDDEINHYIDKYKPFDKAGSYGVHEWIGYVAISSIQGSFYNVMGFPTHRVYEKLKKLL